MNRTPMISVITPSFNCAAYIRQCIESVRGQNYEDFEHIIVDGASTDGTLEILKQYPHLRWISEPDGGEVEALNKALRMARGDIIGWLNADDYYLKDTFHRVAGEIDPRRSRHVVYGTANMVDEKGQVLSVKKSAPVMTLALLLRWWKHPLHPHQPSIFYSKEVVADIGLFNKNLYYSVDYEYWLRIILKYQFHYVNQAFANARIRTNAKSSNSVPAQIQSHWKVSLPYHRYFKLREQVEFWKDYYIDYRIPWICGWLRPRTRLRGLVRMMPKIIVEDH